MWLLVRVRPVCQARFRGTAEWSRCGAELTALMLLAAHVYVMRQATRLHSGSTVIALYAKRQFSKIDLCCGGQYALLPVTEASLNQRRDTVQLLRRVGHFLRRRKQ